MGVRLGVEDGVLVETLVAVAVNCAVPVVTEVARKINTMGVYEEDDANVGDVIEAGREVAMATKGAGVMTTPTAPISTNANPLIKLIIKSLGYFIRVKQPYYYTIYQFAIQVKIIIGSLSTLGADHNFVRLMVKFFNGLNREVGAMFPSTKTNPLIGYEEKTGVFRVKHVFPLIGSLNS